jgi:hypothetical protein
MKNSWGNSILDETSEGKRPIGIPRHINGKIILELILENTALCVKYCSIISHGVLWFSELIILGA